jgi:hypothetical protein
MNKIENAIKEAKKALAIAPNNETYLKLHKNLIEIKK